MPIASGRNIVTLISRLKQSYSTSAQEQQLGTDVQSWEDRIMKEDDTEDPLAIWFDYIKWMQQYITGESMLEKIVELLQRCTRRFQNDPRYKNDIRYLQVWIKYIDTVHDPSDIFNFLEANEIGNDLALTYTSWAMVLEMKKGMYAEAYNKLEEGLKRRAKPMEQIQLALQQFQHRMNKRTMDAMTDVPVESSVPMHSLKSERREFGDEITKSRRLVKPAVPTSSAFSVSRGVARPTSTQATTSANKGGFSIFIDSNGQTESEAAPSAPCWNYLPGEREKVKENTRSATQWNKDVAGTIPVKKASSMAVAASKPRAPKAGIDFELFVDCDVADQETLAKSGPERSSQGALRPVRIQLDGAQVSSRRHQRPLEHLKADDAPASGAP